MAEFKKYHLHKIVNYLESCVGHEELQSIWIGADIVDNKGEINGKHYYFALKEDFEDKSYYLKAVYFNCPMEKKKILYDGGRFEFLGSLSLYKSTVNFKVFDFKRIESIETKIEAVKKKLEALGLVGTNKLKFPRFPKQIALVTAEGHAAINDLITSLEKRYPLVRYKLYPCLVQGDNAPKSICDAIKEASQDKDNDILIIGRGGGSMEDLMAFNDLEVCLAIANLKIPSISAVGHSTDKSLTDLVASKVAITPTSAAEYAVPDANILLKNAEFFTNTIRDYLKNKFIKASESLAQYEQLLLKKSPSNIISSQYQKLDAKKIKLYQSYNNVINNYNNKYHLVPQKLNNIFQFYLNNNYDKLKDMKHMMITGLKNLLSNNYNNIGYYKNLFRTNIANLFNTKLNIITNKSFELLSKIKIVYNGKKELFTSIENNITSNNPKRIFKMGYAKLKTLTNLDINSINNIKINDEYYSYLEDGKIKSKILEIKKYKGE